SLRARAMRGELLKFSNGAALINDSYNSSPAALQAMTELLAATPNFRRRILAAGEMRELGTASPELHREAGQFAAKTGKMDWIIGVAGDAAEIVEGAVAAGLPRARAKFFAAPQEGAEFLAGFIVSRAVPVLLWADLTNPFILLSLFALFGCAVIGFIDDYAKVSKQRNLGLTAKKKIYFQVFVSLIVGVVLLVLASNSAYSTQFVFPFLKRFPPDLVIHSLLGQSPFSGHLWPLAFLPFLVATAIVIVGSSNAVNLTDGLDGLAIGCTVIAAGALTVLTY